MPGSERRRGRAGGRRCDEPHLPALGLYDCCCMRPSLQCRPSGRGDGHPHCIQSFRGDQAGAEPWSAHIVGNSSRVNNIQYSCMDVSCPSSILLFSCLDTMAPVVRSEKTNQQQKTTNNNNNNNNHNNKPPRTT